MSQVNNFKINAAEGTITYTKRFMKAAGVYGSKEYHTLQNLIKDFPTFELVEREIKKKKDKVTFKGLNLAEMERFITEKRSEEELAYFKNVVETLKEDKGKYAKVKQYFLKMYKDIYTTKLEDLSQTEIEEVTSHKEAA